MDEFKCETVVWTGMVFVCPWTFNHSFKWYLMNGLFEGAVLSAGVMGSVEMDESGDRQIDFAMWDMMDVESGEFQVKHL